MQERRRHANKTRGRKIEPLAQPLDDLSQREGFGSDGIEGATRERGILETTRNRFAQIVDMERLEFLITLAEEGNEKRQSGETADRGSAAVTSLRVDERRTQHDPVEVERPQVVIGGFLAERVFGAGGDVGADRGNLHDPAHAHREAGVEQRLRCVGMNRCRRLTGAALQNAGAIDNRINAVKERKPIRARCHAVHIDVPRGDPGEAPLDRREVANPCRHDVTVSQQASAKVPADEAVGPRQENMHADKVIGALGPIRGMGVTFCGPVKRAA